MRGGNHAAILLKKDSGKLAFFLHSHGFTQAFPTAHWELVPISTHMGAQICLFLSFLIIIFLFEELWIGVSHDQGLEQADHVYSCGTGSPLNSVVNGRILIRGLLSSQGALNSKKGMQETLSYGLSHGIFATCSCYEGLPASHCFRAHCLASLKDLQI